MTYYISLLLGRTVKRKRVRVRVKGEIP